MGRCRQRLLWMILLSANGRECLAIRLLPQQIPEAEALGWPEAVLPLCQLRQGLILVTGASGSGKSTTLAAMIEQINRTRACHILTYESPVEYVFENKQALIHQCDVPGEMPSFAAGARDALRMDADVIMLGELADRETMRAAMKLAESGHLVLATMHTGAAAEAVGYFITHFAPEDQLLVQHQLASMLRERGKEITREDLMQKVWNYDYFGDMRTVDVAAGAPALESKLLRAGQEWDRESADKSASAQCRGRNRTQMAILSGISTRSPTCP